MAQPGFSSGVGKLSGGQDDPLQNQRSPDLTHYIFLKGSGIVGVVFCQFKIFMASYLYLCRILGGGRVFTKVRESELDNKTELQKMVPGVPSEVSQLL